MSHEELVKRLELASHQLRWRGAPCPQSECNAFAQLMEAAARTIANDPPEGNPLSSSVGRSG